MPSRKKAASDSVPMLDMPADKKVSEDENRMNALEQLKNRIGQEIGAIFDLLIKESNAIEELKRKTAEEIARQKREHKQEEEQKNLDYFLMDRKRRAEFDEKLEQERRTYDAEKNRKEEEFRSRKETLDGREEELRRLTKEVESFSENIEKTIEETRKQTTAELKKDFDMEKKLLVQKYESDLKLSAQQISSLQTQQKQQEKEIQSLKQEKIAAIEQLKELAVAVVRGKEKEAPSSAMPG